jgi:sugar-phosphatase
MRSREVIRALAPQLDVEREAARLDELEMLYTGGNAITGAGELLRHLPPERWAIVTSASERVARHRLHCAALPLPNLLVGAEAVVNGKPDPEPYLQGLKRLGLPAEQCLVIEDSPRGLAAANAAGIPCIVLRHPLTRGHEFRGAMAVVDSLDELTEILKTQ